jgi:hypothetical protein
VVIRRSICVMPAALAAALPARRDDQGGVAAFDVHDVDAKIARRLGQQQCAGETRQNDHRKQLLHAAILSQAPRADDGDCGRAARAMHRPQTKRGLTRISRIRPR